MKLPLLSTCAVAVALPAFAQDLPETQLNVVGSWGMVSMYTDFTLPFFTQTLPEALVDTATKVRAGWSAVASGS